MSITVENRTYMLPAQVRDVAALPPYRYQLALHAIRASVVDRKWESLVVQQRERLGGTAPAVLPPNQRTDRWDSVKEIAAPFTGAHGGEDSAAFGYWFNYLWNEAREAFDLNAAGKAQLCDAFFAALERDDAGGLRPTSALGQMDNTQLQMLLLKVLRVGFKRLQIKSGATSKAPVAVDAKTLFAAKMSLQGEAERLLPIGFRGDNRPPEELMKTGFIARARSQKMVVHEKFGMDQPWHPFNLEIYADSLFLRKGKSKDNCLHTVISIASQLKEIMPYPLVSDASLFKLASVPPGSWGVTEYAHVASHWLGLNVVKDSSGNFDKITTDKAIYVLNMSRGKGFNTELWQQSLGVSNPFPERAMDGVLPEQILAIIKLRKHYFYNNGEVSLFDVELLSFSLLQDEVIIKASLGDTAPVDIQNFVLRQVRMAQNDYALAKSKYMADKVAAARPAATVAAAGSLTCAPCKLTFKNGMALKFHNQKVHGVGL